MIEILALKEELILWGLRFIRDLTVRGMGKSDYLTGVNPDGQAIGSSFLRFL